MTSISSQISFERSFPLQLGVENFPYWSVFINGKFEEKNNHEPIIAGAVAAKFRLVLPWQKPRLQPTLFLICRMPSTESEEAVKWNWYLKASKPQRFKPLKVSQWNLGQTLARRLLVALFERLSCRTWHVKKPKAPVERHFKKQETLKPKETSKKTQLENNIKICVQAADRFSG